MVEDAGGLISRLVVGKKLKSLEEVEMLLATDLVVWVQGKPVAVD